MLAFADHTFAKYSKVKRSTLINSKPFKKSAPKASQHSHPSGGKFIGSQTVMYKFLCECLANLPCPLSLSLSLSAVHLEYKCTVVERCGQEMSRVSYSDTSSMAGKQTHNSMMFCASLTQDMLSPMTEKTFRMMSSNIT